MRVCRAISVGVGILLFLFFLSLPKLVFSAEVVNGNFETGNLSGWHTYNVGPGNWYPYTGSASPLSRRSVFPPAEGNYGVTTDQNAPGVHILYQDIALEEDSRHTLSFYLSYRNDASAWATPNVLALVFPNQQYRVDIIDPNAVLTSVNSGDVYANIFQTVIGDPLSLAPVQITYDLTPWAGQTVRLRFASVETIFFLRTAVDDVQIESVGLNSPPSLAGNLILQKALGKKSAAYVVNAEATDAEDGDLAPEVELYGVNADGTQEFLGNLSINDVVYFHTQEKKTAIQYSNSAASANNPDKRAWAWRFRLVFRVTDSGGLTSEDEVWIE